MKNKSTLLSFILLLFLCWSFYWDYFSGAENYLQDWLFQKRKPTDLRINLIAIDEESLQTLGGWPWPRSYHAELINKLAKGKPAVIGMDILFTDYAEDPSEDAALVEAAKNAGNVVVGSYGLMPETAAAYKLAPESYIEPFQELKEVTKSGHINVIPDEEDNVVRSFLLGFTFNNQRIDCFDLAIYERYYKSLGKKVERPNIPVDPFNRSYVDYVNDPGQFTYYPYSQVLSEDFDPEIFKDQIVLIGPYSIGMKDYYHTSIQKNAPMFGVEIHANILHNLLQGNLKAHTPEALNMFLMFLFFAACSYAFNKYHPAVSVLLAAAMIGTYTGMARLVYVKGYILSIFYPTVLIAVLFIVALSSRYIEELLERKRVTGIFGRYVAPQVVTEILKGGQESLSLGGVRKEITTLFVDIRGFTPMSEKAEPEEVVNILNNYLNLCTVSIFKFGGTLDKFIGDAAMAIFNAPLDLEDHAFKAVQTAWAMKQGSEALQKELEEKYGRSVQFGIGIHTGHAVVGNIGSKSRMDYTAIGDTVNTAARLESNAKPGQILISQATYELVKSKVQASFLGEIKVKGKTQGIPVYQLDGIRGEVQ